MTLPVKSLEAHWIEQLGESYEVIRVLCVANAYVARVRPHGDRSWRIEKKAVDPHGSFWRTVLTNPSKSSGGRTTRLFRSPEGAMRAAEALFDFKVAKPGAATDALGKDEGDRT